MGGNWTRVPNEILDVADDMAEIELKLTLAIVRRTFGYHEMETRMTYEDMMTATKLSRGSIYAALNMVEARGFFRRGTRSRWIVNSSKFELFNSPNSTKSELSDRENSSKSELYESSKSEPFPSKERKEEKETPPPTPSPADDLQAAWAEIQETIAEFEAITGLKRPYGRSDRVKERLAEQWYAPAYRMRSLANGRTGELMRQAHQELVGKRFTVSSPASIYSTFCRICNELDGQEAETEELNGDLWSYFTGNRDALRLATGEQAGSESGPGTEADIHGHPGRY